MGEWETTTRPQFPCARAARVSATPMARENELVRVGNWNVAATAAVVTTAAAAAAATAVVAAAAAAVFAHLQSSFAHEAVLFAEGKLLASIYKAKHVEISALLSIGSEQLWSTIVKQVQLGIKARDRRFGRRSSNGKRGSGRLTRLMKHGRRIAKSAEELVMRLAAL